MEQRTANGMPSHNLVLTDITKRYGQGPAVIEHLSHTFSPGTATGLVGPNGSGKTTLLRLLSVSSFPSGGKLMHGDIDIMLHPYKYLAHVGIVHDVASLPQYMTAVELLEYILRSRAKWTEKSEDEIDRLLNTLDLDERRQNLIGTYSSGMLKKAQIAAALIANPKVILLDEPFRGLDTSSLQAAVNLLQSFKMNGAIAVISSHRRDVLDELCEEFLSLESEVQSSKSEDATPNHRA